MRNSARRRVAAAASIALVGLALGPLPDGLALAEFETLPLGDADLVETRTTEVLAPGVRLTRIVRGTEPATEGEIATTTRGPWRVNVLRINLARASGNLAASYGPDLANVETTTDLVRSSGALAGVNASFFMLGAKYPGDLVGLGLYSGELLSEPGGHPNEVDLVVDGKSDRVIMGSLGWDGVARNRRTGGQLPLEFLNRQPSVPARCEARVDQTKCDADGDLVRFTPEFGSSTPSGHGVEVVLSKEGCVVRRARIRGTTLKPSQTSLQATGSDTRTLLGKTERGCLNVRLSLTDESGQQLVTHQEMFGVSGRFRLTEAGQTVTPTGTGDFFERNPRTFAGTTQEGLVLLATIDGRQVTSVGTTFDETAAVAQALGMYDAVNLDGGGSTAMSARGDLVNHPSDASGERPVGDALVYVP